MRKMVLAAVLASCGAAMAITDAEIEALIGRMTPAQKVGQLVQIGSAGRAGGPLTQDATGVALPADVAEMVRKGRVETHADLAALALAAGMDQDMMSGLYRRELVRLVKEGKVPMSEIDRSVRNILKVKNALGLWENPYIDEAKLASQIDLAAHARQARAIAAKCCVLLKNDNSVLPLEKGARVALVGPGAEDCDSISGTWSAYIENRFEMTLPEGLRGAGVETVQAYTRQMVGVESRPVREFRAWRKVPLAPGETQHVVLKIPVA